MALEQEQQQKSGPFPMDIDSVGTIGPKPPPGYNNNTADQQLSREELFERAFKPPAQRRPMLSV